MSSNRSFTRLSAGLALMASLAGALLSTSTGAAAPLPACTDAVCVSQQGNVVIVVVPTGVAGSSQVAVTPAPAPPLGSQAVTAGGLLPLGSVDLQASTYAQRQAIRDHYHGHIDELTFNDELGDGVGIYQALADAIAARTAAKPASTR